MDQLILPNDVATELEEIASTTDFAREERRARALLWLAEGETVEEVAERLSVSRQTVYNWVRRFFDRNGENVRARLDDAPRAGRPCTAKGIIDPLLAEVIDRDPRDFGYASTGWTAPILKHHLSTQHGIEVSSDSISLAIERLGMAWK